MLRTRRCNRSKNMGEQLSQQGGSYGENTDEDYPEPQE